VPKLGVIIGSVREGRGGIAVANWFVERAKAHGAFEVTVLDLKELALPIMNEPHHPRLKQYVHESTRAWSATVSAHDAFVLVTPEYNHSTPPAVINALDTLATEWHYKVAGLVTYGGPSGGVRAQQMLKVTLQALKMVCVLESVPLPFYTQLIDKESGTFKATEAHDKAAAVMLDEMRKWTGPLELLRRPT
jgi:NAD(P)H-dependent FMN reductase